MLSSETGIATRVNQGWAAFWLAEALEQTESAELAYSFFRSAELKWQAVAPPKAEIVKRRIDDLLRKHPSLSSVASLHIDERCDSWLKADL